MSGTFKNEFLKCDKFVEYISAYRSINSTFKQKGGICLLGSVTHVML